MKKLKVPWNKGLKAVNDIRVAKSVEAAHEARRGKPSWNSINLVSACKMCGKEFKTIPARLREGRGKFCSKKCQYISMNGQVPWNKGLKMGANPAHGELMKEKYLSGELKYLDKTKFKPGHTPWIKGKSFGISTWLFLNGTHDYRNLHKRIAKKYGQPLLCESCGNTTLTRNLYHWSNISGQYLESKEDWKRLCYRCHAKIDSLTRKKGREVLK